MKYIYIYRLFVDKLFRNRKNKTQLKVVLRFPIWKKRSHDSFFFVPLRFRRFNYSWLKNFPNNRWKQLLCRSIKVKFFPSFFVAKMIAHLIFQEKIMKRKKLCFYRLGSVHSENSTGKTAWPHFNALRKTNQWNVVFSPLPHVEMNNAIKIDMLMILKRKREDVWFCAKAMQNKNRVNFPICFA